MVLVLVYVLRLSACTKNKDEMATHIPTATEMSADGLIDRFIGYTIPPATGSQDIRASFGTP